MTCITTCYAQPKIIKTQGSDQSQNVHCSLQDRAGNLWLGTTGEGVYRYDGKSFIQFTKKDGLNSNTVYAMEEDRTANIWLGTSARICEESRRFSPNFHSIGRDDWQQ